MSDKESSRPTTREQPDFSRLVDAAIKGDKGAEHTVLKVLSERFEVFAAHWIRNRDVAKDMAQDACCVVLEKYRTEQFTTSFEAWAYGVLRTTVKNYNYCESKRLNRLSSGPLSLPSFGASPGIDPAVLHRLRYCLRRLVSRNRRYARVLTLRFQGFRTQEICERIGSNRNNFYVLLNRARALLKDCLLERWPE
jgi:DNA-directed RNA polymerase specialized sigma24 family protein